MTGPVILIACALMSPRQTETFSGVKMDAARARLNPALAVAASPVPTTMGNDSFAWQGNPGDMGYRLYQYSGSLTNVYNADQQTITIDYNWPNHIPRWFYYVTATNEIDESD